MTTVFVEVHIDGDVRRYEATEDTLSRARYEAEKKARAYLRRQGLSVKMDNVVKERCPECEELTIITVNDLDVPPPHQPIDDLEDDFDWILSDDYHL